LSFVCTSSLTRKHQISNTKGPLGLQPELWLKMPIDAILVYTLFPTPLLRSARMLPCPVIGPLYGVGKNLIFWQAIGDISRPHLTAARRNVLGTCPSHWTSDASARALALFGATPKCVKTERVRAVLFRRSIAAEQPTFRPFGRTLRPSAEVRLSRKAWRGAPKGGNSTA